MGKSATTLAKFAHDVPIRVTASVGELRRQRWSKPTATAVAPFGRLCRRSA
jgi:hypothetical protein